MPRSNSVHRKILFTPSAASVWEALCADARHTGLAKQVGKVLGLLETNIRHPSLQTHKFYSLQGPRGEDVFEAYVQQHTPGAYRVFFFYGPDEILKGKRTPVITVFAIVRHP